MKEITKETKSKIKTFIVIVVKSINLSARTTNGIGAIIGVSII